MRQEQTYRVERLRGRLDRSGGAPGRVVVVWFYGVSDTLQPVEVLVPRAADPALAAVRELIRGAPEADLLGPTPAYVRVQGVQIRDGVATVDLDPATYEVPQGSYGTAVFVHLLTYTLTEFPGVNRVRVQVGGKPAPLHGSIWDEPRGRSSETHMQIGKLIRYEGPGRP